MPKIARRRRIVEGGRLCRVGRGGRGNLTGGQHGFDQGNQPLQQPGSAKKVAAGAPDLGLKLRPRLPPPSQQFCRCLESRRDHGFEFHEIGNIVNERKRLTDVQKADGRGIARRQHRRFG